MADGIHRQPIVWPRRAIGVFPRHVIGQHPKAATTQFLGHTHIEIAGFRGGHSYLADQLYHLFNVPTILIVCLSAVGEQIMICLMPTNHFSLNKLLKSVAKATNFIRYFQSNTTHFQNHFLFCLRVFWSDGGPG